MCKYSDFMCIGQRPRPVLLGNHASVWAEILNHENGRDDWIRTSNLTHPKRARYQAALRPDRGATQASRQFNESSGSSRNRPEIRNFDSNERITGVREASRKRVENRADQAAFFG